MNKNIILLCCDTHNHEWAYLTSGENWYSYRSDGDNVPEYVGLLKLIRIY